MAVLYHSRVLFVIGMAMLFAVVAITVALPTNVSVAVFVLTYPPATAESTVFFAEVGVIAQAAVVAA